RNGSRTAGETWHPLPPSRAGSGTLRQSERPPACCPLPTCDSSSFSQHCGELPAYAVRCCRANLIVRVSSAEEHEIGLHGRSFQANLVLSPARDKTADLCSHQSQVALSNCHNPTGLSISVAHLYVRNNCTDNFAFCQTKHPKTAISFCLHGLCLHLEKPRSVRAASPPFPDVRN